MIECRICGAVIKERDLIHIQVDSWRDRPDIAGGWFVCPLCLEELVSEHSQKELTDEEEAEMREEELADMEFHRRRDEAWGGL